MAARAFRRCRLLAVVAVLVLVAGCGQDSTSQSTSTSARADNGLDAGVVQRLNDTINKTMDETSIPGAIVGIWGPDGDFVQTFGVADQAGGEPMKTDFYHRIGSQTKTFTVTGVLQLADQGKLGLDDPISKFVDGVPEGDTITLRQLARMQSGLPNYS
uniref:serine hydrolase domain-containing protein n=2 Tax=Mycobacteriaceae TaxID=1762 RepID=UPI0021F31649